MTSELGVNVADVSASGEAVAGGSKVYGLALVPNGTAAATAVVRQVDGSGAVKARLQCPGAGPPDRALFNNPIAFKGAVHVTLTGTGATLQIYHRPSP